MSLVDYGHRSVPNVFLTAPLQTINAKAGTGPWNAAHFSNTQYDKLVAAVRRGHRPGHPEADRRPDRDPAAQRDPDHLRVLLQLPVGDGEERDRRLPDRHRPHLPQPGGQELTAAPTPRALHAAADLGPGLITEIARGRGVRITPGLLEAVRERCQQARATLRQGAPVYGVNTGMGALSGIRLTEQQQRSHQRNLLLARATGGPPWLDPAEVRALVAVRLRTFLSGDAGVSAELCQRLADLLDEGIIPAVPRDGSGSAGRSSRWRTRSARWPGSARCSAPTGPPGRPRPRCVSPVSRCSPSGPRKESRCSPAYRARPRCPCCARLRPPSWPAGWRPQRRCRSSPRAHPPIRTRRNAPAATPFSASSRPYPAAHRRRHGPGSSPGGHLVPRRRARAGPPAARPRWPGGRGRASPRRGDRFPGVPGRPVRRDRRVPRDRPVRLL